MKVLISPVSLKEAHAVIEGNADIIDVKNTNEGSLGASFPWIINEIAETFKDKDVTFSATLGDLDFKPGTASLAARGAVTSGARYIKAGLKDIADFDEGVELMRAVYRSVKDYDPGAIVVTAGYADYRRFGGLDPQTLVRIAEATNCEVVMVDTAIKDGKNLFDSMSLDEIREFIEAGHRAGLEVALAGSVQVEHLKDIADMNCDIVGVRGAVCSKRDRTTGIIAEEVANFVNQVRAFTAVS